MRTRIAVVCGLFLVLSIGSPLFAQPRPNVVDGGNRWLISGFDDASPNHTFLASHQICFFATGMNGTHFIGDWFALAFPNWRGRWAQEGDRLVMHGEFGDRRGHDAMVIDLFAGTTPNDEGAGQWTEWIEVNPIDRTQRFATARLQRVGGCSPPPGITDVAKASKEDLEKAIAELAAKVPPRMKTDGKPATYPLEANQVPVQ